MDIAEFLLARIRELEVHANLYDDMGGAAERVYVLPQCEIDRKIIEYHKQWPVLVEQQEEPTFLDDYDNGMDFNKMSIRVYKKIAWFTEQEYIKKFGTAPAAAPILRIMAQPYRDHPDFNLKWLL